MTIPEQAFALGEKFFENLRHALWSRTLPLVVLALAAGLLVRPPGAEVNPAITLLVACILLPVGGFTIWRTYKRMVATYQGFRLFVGEDRLRRVQPGLPDLEISRDEVNRIVEVPGKGLTVFGTGHQRFIGVPAGLDGFEEVRALLVTWKAPEEHRGGLASWSSIFFGLLGVVAFGLVIGSENRLLVTTLGVGLIGLLVYCIVVMRKSPHLDARTRKAVWFFPLMILALVLRIWVVWHPM